eukprot:8928507-Alexandrium_andersonii.AAC.1
MPGTPSDDGASEAAMEAPRRRAGAGDGWPAGAGDGWPAGAGRTADSAQDAGGCGRRAGCSTAVAALPSGGVAAVVPAASAAASAPAYASPSGGRLSSDTVSGGSVSKGCAWPPIAHDEPELTLEGWLPAFAASILGWMVAPLARKKTLAANGYET